MLLLSIKPQFVRMILSGEKTVELRRRAPRCSKDFWIALYATRPVMAILGVARVEDIIISTPDRLWGDVYEVCGIGREDYARYFNGTTRAVGLKLSEPEAFATPWDLGRLRRAWPDFRPPMSFCYLSSGQADQVWERARVNPVRNAVG